MGSALYPVFDMAIPIADALHSFDGAALARTAYDDDSPTNMLCARLGIRKIAEFYSESNQEAFEKIGEEVPADLNPDDGLEWFEPQEALDVISKILEADHSVEHNEPLKQDLRGLWAVLEIATLNKCLFRLRIDV